MAEETFDGPPAQPVEGVYDVPFSSESSHGRIVRLILEHLEPGLVIDIGCGYAPHAERLRESGFGYAGVDADPDAVSDVAGRGYAARVCNLNVVSALVPTLDDLLEEQEVRGQPIAAVLALDVLEHLVEPHYVLEQLAAWMSDRHVSTLGISLPNVSHHDVVLNLLVGRFDLTETGLLDHTHLRFFTEASMRRMLASAGFAETAENDVRSPKSDHPTEFSHPVLSDGALLGSFARQVRNRADRHGETFQFVRLFELDHDAASSPTLIAPRQQPLEHGLAVLVSAACDPIQRQRLHSQLAVQQSASIEVIDVTETGFQAAAESVEMEYFAVVVGGEQLAPDWAAQFLATAALYPGSVIRSGPLVSSSDWSVNFDLLAHLTREETPPAAVALPTSAVRSLDLRIEDRAGLPDVHTLLLEAYPVCGVIDTGVGTLDVPPGWRTLTDSGGVDRVLEVRSRLAASPFLLPPGVVDHLANTAERLGETEVRCEVLEHSNAQLARITNRRSVRFVVRLTDVARRLLRLPE